MSRRMFVPFHGDGIISQFEGYEDLEELDWDAYRAKYGNIQRLDRILRAEGDDPNRYKVAKQADTVMLFFLFSPDELRRLFERLGYAYGPDTARKNIAYYDERTSHGSTLSFVAHGGVLARLDAEGSWERFLVALESDVGDVQGGTTKEGIHMGVMSGTLDLVQRSYAGTEIRDGVLYFDPRLPARLDGLSFAMQFRGTPIRVTLADGRLTLTAHREGVRRPISVGVGDEVRELRAGDRCTFELRPGAQAGRSAGRRLTGGRVPAFQGAIFDVDGVLVDSPHEKAWRESLRELMEGEWSDIRDRTTWSPAAFTPQVYQEEMSGKPRMSGARAALEYFHVPDDDDAAPRGVRRAQAGDGGAAHRGRRLHRLSRRAAIHHRRQGRRHPGRGGVIVEERAAVPAQDPARHVRPGAGITSASLRPGLTLLDFFDADVSGRDFAHGKPDPEMFLTAARELGVAPHAAMVIEDAAAGVEAAKAGDMAAIGIARADDADLLTRAGADIVVTTLDEVDRSALAAGRLATKNA